MNRRWIRRPASGPVTSYLMVEYRSQRPVAVRIASYSFCAVSPTVMAQGHPSSQTISAPAASWTSCNGERRSSSVMCWSFLSVAVDRFRRSSVRRSVAPCVNSSAGASAGRRARATSTVARTVPSPSATSTAVPSAAASVRRMARPMLPSFGLIAGLVRTPTSSPARVTVAPYSGSTSPSTRNVLNRFGGSAATSRSRSLPMNAPAASSATTRSIPRSNGGALVLGVVVVGDDHAGLDAERLDHLDAVRGRAGCLRRPPTDRPHARGAGTARTRARR